MTELETVQAQLIVALEEKIEILQKRIKFLDNSLKYVAKIPPADGK